MTTNCPRAKQLAPVGEGQVQTSRQPATQPRNHPARWPQPLDLPASRADLRPQLPSAAAPHGLPAGRPASGAEILAEAAFGEAPAGTPFSVKRKQVHQLLGDGTPPSVSPPSASPLPQRAQGRGTGAEAAEEGDKETRPCVFTHCPLHATRSPTPRSCPLASLLKPRTPVWASRTRSQSPPAERPAQKEDRPRGDT